MGVSNTIPEALRHYHVSEADAGCLPDAEPYVTDDAPLALDALAHLMSDWAHEADPDEPDSAGVAAIAEIYCLCPGRDKSAEHRDALALLAAGHGITETAGQRVFEIAPCTERDCLKYCPQAGCRTVTCANGTDNRCWSCGDAYVTWDVCPWLG
jgi:hypothetical protein